MPSSRLDAHTWEEVRDLPKQAAVPILPLAAMEAHGPHLPLHTDALIAEAMAREGARLLLDLRYSPLLLPTLAYAPAFFARDFPGTVAIDPDVFRSFLVDLGSSVARAGFRALAVANAHLDPDHLRSVHDAARVLRRDTPLRIAFPDLTRKPWAVRLTDEFRSGACHAGRFETSVVAAERPELVRDAIRADLPPNPSSLSRAIHEGKSSFTEAGGPRAYFGFPADATPEEGRRTVAVLGTILADAVREEFPLS